MLYKRFENGFTRLTWVLAGITAMGGFYLPIFRWFRHGPIGEYFGVKGIFEGIISGGFSFTGWLFHLIPGLLAITVVFIIFKIAVYAYDRLIRFVLKGFDEDLAVLEKKDEAVDKVKPQP